MNVERRYSRRYPMTGDVYIRYRQGRAFYAQASNCSVYGVHLKTENLSLLTGSVVELEFFYNGKQWLITGLVIHGKSDGIGVMFWQTQPELYRMVVARSEVEPRKTSPVISGALWGEPGQSDIGG